MSQTKGNPVRRVLRGWLAQIPPLEALARLTLETIRVCLRYRVTGLASEAGFFALLSLPPLVLGLFGGVGYVGRWLGEVTVDQVRTNIEAYAARFLTQDVIDSTLGPTVDDVFRGGRFELISLGFVLSIWSGSRALNVFLDTISIMYGQSDIRGIVRTRALSLVLYVAALIVGIITIPLVLIGPTWLGQILPEQLKFLTVLYWPVVSVVTVASLASLFHIATPQRSPWLRDVPGAALTLVIWLIASFVVRGFITSSLGGNSTSIYGPLAAPIVILIWLYFLAIAILIGAALNAAIRDLWPSEETRGLRQRAKDKVRAVIERRGESGESDVRGDDSGEDDDEAADQEERERFSWDGIKAAARRPLTPIKPGHPLDDRLADLSEELEDTQDSERRDDSKDSTSRPASSRR